MHASFGAPPCGLPKFFTAWIMAISNDPCSTTMVPIERARGEIIPRKWENYFVGASYHSKNDLTPKCSSLHIRFLGKSNTNASNFSHLMKTNSIILNSNCMDVN